MVTDQRLCPICTFPLIRAEDGDAHAGCVTWQARKQNQHAKGVQIALDALVPVIHHDDAVCGKANHLTQDEPYDLVCKCGLWDALEQLKKDYGVTYARRHD